MYSFVMAVKYAQINKQSEVTGERNQVFTRLTHENDRSASTIVEGSVKIIWMTLRTLG